MKFLLKKALERVSDVLLEVQKKFNYSHVVASASAFSRGVLPRVAAKLDVSPISDVTDIHDENTFTRPTYAGNANAKVIYGFIPVKFLKNFLHICFLKGKK